MIKKATGTVAGFKVPKRIIFSETPLPRTPTGKVTRYLLREAFSESEESTP
jgi:acyl-coenzyme A synthetase/AMP-(fatty) acid ligase